VTSRSALLFDLDGTLVDSDPKHLAAFQRVFAAQGIMVDQTVYERDIHGAPNERIGALFLSHLPPERRRVILAEKEATYRSDLGHIEPIAGVGALLDFADRLGLKRAVVTNAPRANAETVLSALGLQARLPIVVTGSELARAKPDPLPFLKSLELTGALAARSVAFEDSPSGICAAASAGLIVVGLTTTLGEAALIEAGATIAADDFTDLRIFALIEARIGVARNVGARV
jgi:beta-phosphoglucomutase-like phosphatase (HAD superfamily)